MEYKKNSMLLVLAAMLLLVSTGVMAANTFVLPAASTPYGGTLTMNVTVQDINLTRNCTVTGTSSYQGATFTVTLLNTTALGGVTNLSGIYDTTQMNDSTWTLAGTCTNGPNSTTLTARSFYIDNTLPDAPTNILPTTSDEKTGIEFTADVNATVTDYCTLSVIASYQTDTYTMTRTASQCAVTVDSLPGSGHFELSVTASDGYNVSSAGTSTLDVTEGGGAGGQNAARAAAADEAKSDADAKNKIFVVVIIALAAAYLFGFFDKKKR